MTDTIEPGDLIRDGGFVEVAEFQCRCCELIAKGPGWVRHDGSSVNPVPGAECEVLSPPTLRSKKWSETWNWPSVTFYRVTSPAEAPAHPPAPSRGGWLR